MGETIVYGIKCTLVGLALGAFMIAVATLTAFILAFTSNTVVGELLGIFSMCLPFNAGTVFASLLAGFNCIISFVVARKLYQLVLKSNEAT